MTHEQLKSLRLEDFQVPNQVLCYGAGLMGRQMIESYKLAGVNVVGFIDKNKHGAVETALGPVPIYSIDAAIHTFGTDITVVITIANPSIYPDIRAGLMEAGVSNRRIYDWGFDNWITVPSPKCYCDWLFGNTTLLTTSLLKCSFWGDHRYFNAEILDPSVPFEESLRSYAEKTQHYYQKCLEGEVPLYCAGCPHLEDKPLKSFPLFNSLVFSPSVHCNVECVYCDAIMETDNSKLPYDAKGYGELFFAMLRFFDEHHLIAPQARITYAGGEITVSPKRKELLEFALEHPEYRYTFLSNGVVFNEAIAQVLAQNPDNYIMCDLDAGTPETYTLIKGYNYFEKVVSNLEKYIQHGQVNLKYIVMPDFNTTPEDYKCTVKILKALGLTQLTLSQDHYHFLNVREERRSLFEVARFKMILEKNGISGILYRDSFSEKQLHLVERLFKQLSQGLKGES